MKLILASNSPRRRELLEEMGYSFSVIPAKGEEVFQKKYSAEENVRAVARFKAQEIQKEHEGVIIAADTIVVIDGEILGKPKDATDCHDMLSRLSGNKHYVYTGVCVLTDTVKYNYVIKSTVYFKKISDQMIIRYINSGEPMDKAGGYAIQGQGRELIKKYHGELDNIIGLPRKKLRRILRAIKRNMD